VTAMPEPPPGGRNKLELGVGTGGIVLGVGAFLIASPVLGCLALVMTAVGYGMLLGRS
jgi:hypothetical protein